MTAQYADIGCPMVMQWEHPANFSHTSNRETLTYCSHVIDPCSRPEAITRSIAPWPSVSVSIPTSWRSLRREIFANQIPGATVIKEGGFTKKVGSGAVGPGGATTEDMVDPDFEKLLTITAEDWAELGFPRSRAAGGSHPASAILEGRYLPGAAHRGRQLRLHRPGGFRGRPGGESAEH
ncbi:MAG: hypothetical protein ACLTSX_13295 [Collinsella sp.]